MHAEMWRTRRDAVAACGRGRPRTQDAGGSIILRTAIMLNTIPTARDEYQSISSFFINRQLDARPVSAQHPVLSSQFSVLSSQSLVLSPQFSVLSPQSSVLSPQFSVLSPQSSVLGSWFLVLGSRFSVLGSPK
jgi:hypothetical protein